MPEWEASPSIIPHMAGTSLLIEGEMLIVLDVETTLAERGHSVVVVDSIAAAMAAIGGHGIGGAVLDWHLKSDSSSDLAVALRSREIPFVFCSGSAPEHLERLFPGVPFISKPFHAADLITPIETALGTKVARS